MADRKTYNLATQSSDQTQRESVMAEERRAVGDQPRHTMANEQHTTASLLPNMTDFVSTEITPSYNMAYGLPPNNMADRLQPEMAVPQTTMADPTTKMAAPETANIALTPFANFRLPRGG